MIAALIPLKKGNKVLGFFFYEIHLINDNSILIHLTDDSQLYIKDDIATYIYEGDAVYDWWSLTAQCSSKLKQGLKVDCSVVLMRCNTWRMSNFLTDTLKWWIRKLLGFCPSHFNPYFLKATRTIHFCQSIMSSSLGAFLDQLQHGAAAVKHQLHIWHHRVGYPYSKHTAVSLSSLLRRNSLTWEKHVRILPRSSGSRISFLQGWAQRNQQR